MSNKDDDERFWNLIIYKMYMTDKEMEEVMPFYAGVVLIGLVIFGIIVCCGAFF